MSRSRIQRIDRSFSIVRPASSRVGSQRYIQHPYLGRSSYRRPFIGAMSRSRISELETPTGRWINQVRAGSARGAPIKALSAWCHDTHRSREDVLRGVTGFNAKEDRRHDRRTISLV